MPPTKRASANNRMAGRKKKMTIVQAADEEAGQLHTVDSQTTGSSQKDGHQNDGRAKLEDEPEAAPRQEANMKHDVNDGEDDDEFDFDGEELSSASSDPEQLSARVGPHAGNDSGDGDRGAAPSSERPVWAGGYNAYKTFNGKVYTGMRVGGKHVWNYEPGEWKETKVEPDLWHVDFDVKKHRRGRAPAGSGVPVGSKYHWYIVAHQFVEKVDDNIYTTRLTGYKYKLAHKRAGTADWNIKSEEGRRRREVAILEDAVRRVRGDAEHADVHGKKRLVKKAGRPLEKGQATLEAMFGKFGRAATAKFAKESADASAASSTDAEAAGSSGGSE